MDMVSEEYSLAKQQMDERWLAYRAARDQNTDVSNEFARLKALQDEKFKERNEVRDLIRSVQDSYYENRRFSQKVIAARVNLGIYMPIASTVMSDLSPLFANDGSGSGERAAQGGSDRGSISGMHVCHRRAHRPIADGWGCLCGVCFQLGAVTEVSCVSRIHRPERTWKDGVHA